MKAWRNGAKVKFRHYWQEELAWTGAETWAGAGAGKGDHSHTHLCSLLGADVWNIAYSWVEEVVAPSPGGRGVRFPWITSFDCTTFVTGSAVPLYSVLFCREGYVRMCGTLAIHTYLCTFDSGQEAYAATMMSCFHAAPSGSPSLDGIVLELGIYDRDGV